MGLFRSKKMEIKEIKSGLRQCNWHLNKLVNMELNARNEVETLLLQDAARYWIGEEERLQKKLKWLTNPNPKKTIDIDIIKEQVKVADYLKIMGCKLIPFGKRLKCKCIFHNEKSPSLVIYPETNSYYCFGCGEGGSIIDLVMKTQGMTVSQAVKKLSSFIN